MIYLALKTFEVEWAKSEFDQNHNRLDFSETHQHNFDNILKAPSLWSKTFLLNYSYYTNIVLVIYEWYFIKEAIYQKGGYHADYLASVLDFYYKRSPIIVCNLTDKEMKAKYLCIC